MRRSSTQGYPFVPPSCLSDSSGPSTELSDHSTHCLDHRLVGRNHSVSRAHDHKSDPHLVYNMLLPFSDLTSSINHLYHRHHTLRIPHLANLLPRRSQIILPPAFLLYLENHRD